MLAIRSRLTKDGSEFQDEVSRVLEGEASSCTPIAVYHSDAALVGWACSHVWNDMQTLEQFVDERHRKSGKATALSAMLTSTGTIDTTKPLAVFSPVTALIARKLGALNIHEFTRSGNGWAEV
jgi:hypothetical protein